MAVMVELMERDEFLALALPYAEAYTAAPHVQEPLATIDAVTLTGGAGVGKDYIRSELGYPAITGWTTRDMRPGEVNGSHYWFLGRGISRGYGETLELIRNQLVVQLALGPDRKNLYGSFYEDWESRVGSRCSFDVVYPTAREFRTKPFRSVMNFFVTPADFDMWQHQWLQRNDGTDSNDRANRILEAHDSFRECLEDDGFIFVVNDGRTNQAVDVIRQVVERRIHDTEYEKRARKVGGLILAQLETTLETI